MAPTLLGRSEMMLCGRCNYQGKFPIERGKSACQCPQCGQVLTATGQWQSADQVEADDSPAPIIRGDLVAIKLKDREVVKRVAGIPGDVIDVDGLQLTIDREPIPNRIWDNENSDQIPTVLVHRETGTWKPRWQRRDRWLIYHHFNPYRGMVPTPVLDDYAVNANLSRRLEPVSELIVTGRCTTQPFSKLEILTWKTGGEPKENSPISETTPIAIRIDDTTGQVCDLEVRRRIEYRLRPKDKRTQYPVTLGKDQFFVLGDNVPISVDSRQWGAVSHDQIICRVQKLARTPDEL